MGSSGSKSTHYHSATNSSCSGCKSLYDEEQERIRSRERERQRIIQSGKDGLKAFEEKIKLEEEQLKKQTQSKLKEETVLQKARIIEIMKRPPAADAKFCQKIYFGESPMEIIIQDAYTSLLEHEKNKIEGDHSKSISAVEKLLNQMNFARHMSNPIDYQPVSSDQYVQQEMKRVICFGRMGQGKSTLLNALVKGFKQLDSSLPLVKFKCSNQPTACTKQCEEQIMGQFSIIDTPGFGDTGNIDGKVERPDGHIWDDMISLIRHQVFSPKDPGVNSFVSTIMVPAGGRPDKGQFEYIAQLLLTLTMGHKNFPLQAIKEGRFPKIYIVFTNFSPLSLENNAKCLDSDDEMTDLEDEDNQLKAKQEHWEILKAVALNNIADLLTHKKANQIRKEEESKENEVKNTEIMIDENRNDPQTEVEKLGWIEILKLIFTPDKFLHFHKGASMTKESFKLEQVQIDQLAKAIFENPSMKITNHYNPATDYAVNQESLQFAVLEKVCRDYTAAQEIYSILLRLVESLINQCETSKKKLLEDKTLNEQNLTFPLIEAFLECLNEMRNQIEECFGNEQTFILQKSPNLLTHYILRAIDVLSQDINKALIDISVGQAKDILLEQQKSLYIEQQKLQKEIMNKYEGLSKSHFKNHSQPPQVLIDQFKQPPKKFKWFWESNN